jgi:hypothetical protein
MAKSEQPLLSVVSNHISAMRYNEGMEELDIEFTAGQTYRYFDVNPLLGKQMLKLRETGVAGKFFRGHIRDRHEYTRLDG